MKVESVKPTKAPADSGSLHKKMMQLLSSLWVTHAIGTFARLGLADAMEAGAEDAGNDRQAARPPHRSRVSPAARALDLRHRHRKRRRQVCADAARAPAHIERAELHAHVGGTAHRIQRRDLEPPRWRAGRRHRIRGAEGQASVRLAARQSGRGRALPAHDGRGALAGDAGHCRSLRFLAVQAHRRRRRRPRHAAVGIIAAHPDVRGTLFDCRKASMRPSAAPAARCRA